MQEHSFQIGNTVVTKLLDLYLNDFTAEQLLPGVRPERFSGDAGVFDSRTYNPQSGKVSLSVHSWLVHHEGKVLLIDTAAGNDKDRPQLKPLDRLNEPYLERLDRLGVRPDQVDYILLTHIHADHVGWNTVWRQERWQPTFPQATIICSDREWRYSAALADQDEETAAAIRKEAGFGDAKRLPTLGVFADSMAPIEAEGRLQRIVVDGAEVLKGVRFLPTPGHSIDHAAISITSQGHEAIFGGDVVHHPFEWSAPDLVSMFCEFPEAARLSRRKLGDRVAESGALYFSSHFPASSVGKITKADHGYRWTFAEPDMQT